MDNETLKRQREFHAKWRAEKIAAGLCTSCGVNKTHAGRVRCRECLKKRLEKAREYQREKYLAMPAWKKTTLKREKLRRLREKVVFDLGGECVCCGESIPEFLTFDHANGDGKKDRTTNAQKQMLRDVLHGKRSDIRLLCFNCNCGRERNFGQCPHHGKAERVWPDVRYPLVPKQKACGSEEDITPPTPSYEQDSGVR